jgi:hypothetical protein
MNTMNSNLIHKVKQNNLQICGNVLQTGPDLKCYSHYSLEIFCKKKHT